ncbi:lysosomal thioesterase PPT2-A-like isoform X2 [Haliotis rubra]|uniref:lysosomal thioesterase PPT2-A-like isoform X2 n=1 Tax=Haliotis rubra TaxID=36100 RepID=UPI001EE61C3D|nr:lysosomal thioesterase PPT2-A-like isoform X2 [Haliotis rubra]
MAGYRVLLLLSTTLMGMTAAYKHVVFMHGVLAGIEEFTPFVKQLKIDHPGTNVTLIKAYSNLHSLKPLWSQVGTIKAQLTAVMNSNPAGIHLVCFSQGGLICRGLLSVLRHNVDTFIALSCPLAGQYGYMSYMKKRFPKYVTKHLYKVLYTKAGQDISLGNFWMDPHHLTQYRKYSQFLAVINNDTDKGQSHTYKQNFSHLKKLVLIGGPDDGVITPWQTGHFGMFNSSEAVLPMEDQRWYKEDSFGLRTLNVRKAIKMLTFSGVHHTKWHVNMTIYENGIKPFLT